MNIKQLFLSTVIIGATFNNSITTAKNIHNEKSKVITFFSTGTGMFIGITPGMSVGYVKGAINKGISGALIGSVKGATIGITIGGIAGGLLGLGLSCIKT